MSDFQEFREFLKDSLRKTIDFRRSAQHQGIPAPPMQDPADDSLPRIALPTLESCVEVLGEKPLVELISQRKSRRRFTNDMLRLEELSFLLWSTQGQRDPGAGQPQFRTVPSAGARHSFETYLFIQRVEKVVAGLYRYLPLSHELVLHSTLDSHFRKNLVMAVFGQKFVADGAVVFVWVAVPERMEWRYLEAAHRVMLLDAGHICQNLYLSCEVINGGTCAVAAYDQEAMDQLLGVDGENRFTVYLAPVGRV